MPVHRNEPSLPFMRLHQEIDRIFEDAFRGRNFSMPLLLGSSHENFGGNLPMLRPAVNIAENEKQYTVTVEIPGIEEKDIQIQLDDDTLIIQGEKKQEQEHKDANFHRIERSFGSFQRVLTLPQDVDPDSVNAHFKNGILTISVNRVPEKAPKHPRRIEIAGPSSSTSENTSTKTAESPTT